MGSPFDAGRRAADHVQAAWFGEPVRLVFRRAVAGRAPEPDPDHPAVVIRAVFTLVPAAGRLEGERSGTEFSGMTRVAAAVPELWIPAEAVARLTRRPGKPDRIAFVGRSEAYAVAKLGPADDGGLKLTLTAE